jgi:hypothetical protein
MHPPFFSYRYAATKVISHLLVHSGMLTSAWGLNGFAQSSFKTPDYTCMWEQLHCLAWPRPAHEASAGTPRQFSSLVCWTTNIVFVYARSLRAAANAHVRRWMAEFMPCNAYCIARKKVDVHHQGLSRHVPGSENSGFLRSCRHTKVFTTQVL